MYPNFTFNNVRKDYIGLMEHQRPYRATRKSKLIGVPNRPGAYHAGQDTEVIVIPVKILIDAPSPFHLKQTAEEVAAWLTTDRPVPLVFDDYPERTYMAVVEGALIPDEFITYAELTFEFLVPDGYVFGPERSEVFDADVMTITNDGSRETAPLFRAEIHQDITNLDIIGMDGYMRVGAPAPVNQVPIQSQTKLLTDELGSLTGWTVSGAVDNGHVTGQMQTDGDGFYGNLWGTIVPPAAWQGPSLTRSAPEALKNFIVEVDVEQINGNLEAGMLEVYLRDSAGNVIAKIGISDEWRNSRLNRGKFQVGNVDGGSRKSWNAQPSDNAAWNNFRGVLRITRRGQQFTAYFALVSSTGVHSHPVTLNFFDSLSAYQADVTSIQIALRKWPDAQVPVTQMKVKKLQIWKLNTTTTSDPVYIARAGDVIEIDHSNALITINGEKHTWLKDFGSTYFKLKPGQNQITFAPSFAATLSVFWRERYL